MNCKIHREALASKSISPSFDEVLQSTIKIVNFIKIRSLKSRCFEQMCVDMGAEHTSLLYYCNSRWLSRGNVVARLNILNKSLQGNETHIFELLDKITAFQRKLVVWKTKIEDNTFNDCFPMLHTFLKENDMNLNEIVKNPFSADLPTNLSSIEQEQWIDVTSDSTMKSMFGSSSLTQFWTHLKLQYSKLATKALKNLTPFATLYLCETGFSALAFSVTVARLQQSDSVAMFILGRVQISDFTTDNSELHKNKKKANAPNAEQLQFSYHANSSKNPLAFYSMATMFEKPNILQCLNNGVSLPELEDTRQYNAY
ncbi:zinc finger BED domain-containing protein 5-like [Rhopalosiphum padi]|uniref:zinc finger BED domain-containing protein 5-like n=1 Tax=Rhopalosiphum padi TaxID=40932 RepID=UPI00298DC417|nr:zinc finger BED domain-containing protein 5-like [Rhopalosiphum padi]